MLFHSTTYNRHTLMMLYDNILHFLFLENNQAKRHHRGCLIVMSHQTLTYTTRPENSELIIIMTIAARLSFSSDETAWPQQLLPHSFDHYAVTDLILDLVGICVHSGTPQPLPNLPLKMHLSLIMVLLM